MGVGGSKASTALAQSGKPLRPKRTQTTAVFSGLSCRGRSQGQSRGMATNSFEFHFMPHWLVERPANNRIASEASSESIRPQKAIVRSISEKPVLGKVYLSRSSGRSCGDQEC